ncbi:ankyrin repeat domain-containing protein [Paenibacillus alginolyticus]|uniref:ankyrin repeat domain-containing protein n=1 Tax=Paenibacillus alginolyticus TaxID=59839 RepID=UPI0003F4EDA7|nr:ankyrin repeat domain-containing protein [Paenibacillus alginolyticus]MCY9666507.1 ankyrin repeat domain-containing protein [Paenibacillus alginolyticus]
MNFGQHVLGEVLILAFFITLLCVTIAAGILLLNLLATESFLMLIIWFFSEIVILAIIIATFDGISNAYSKLNSDSGNLGIIIIAFVVISFIFVYIKLSNYHTRKKYQEDLLNWVEGGLFFDSNRYENIEKLLSKKTNCNFLAPTYGCSPLTVAAAKRDIRCIKMLLDAKADPNLRDSHGDTAIMYAHYLGDTHLVNLLKKFGAKDLKPKQ